MWSVLNAAKHFCINLSYSCCYSCHHLDLGAALGIEGIQPLSHVCATSARSGVWGGSSFSATQVGKREEAGKKGGSNKLGSPRAHLGSFVGLVLGSVEGDRC